MKSYLQALTKKGYSHIGETYSFEGEFFTLYGNTEKTFFADRIDKVVLHEGFKSEVIYSAE